jgi:hypothetical protein
MVWVGLVLIIVGVILLVVRNVMIPAIESRGSEAVVAPQATLAVQQTQAALTPRATPTWETAAAVAPTAEPATQVPTVAAAAPASAPQPTATSQPTATAVAAAEPTSAPEAGAVDAEAPAPTETPEVNRNVPPDVQADVAQAFLHYFDVRGQALLNLDPSQLPDVAAEDALAGLQREIEDDRAAGHAFAQDYRIEYRLVAVEGDEVVVAARIHDSSIWVDPETHDPLPGQVKPSSPDQAPMELTEWHLKQLDGTWKVVSGETQA